MIRRKRGVTRSDRCEFLSEFRETTGRGFDRDAVVREFALLSQTLQNLKRESRRALARN